MSREVDNVPMINKKQVVHDDKEKNRKARDGRRPLGNGIGQLVSKSEISETKNKMPVALGPSCRELFEKRFSSVKNRGINF